MNDLQKMIFAFLSATLKLDATAAASLLNEDGSPKPEALQTLLDKDAARVAAFTAKQTEHFNNGFAKAKSEVLGAFETDLKSKLKVTSDKKGLELVDEIIEQIKEANKKGDITPDDIMRSQTYKDLQTKAEADIKKATDELSQKLAAQETQQKKKETFETVKAKAKAALEAMKPILSTDPAKAANQMEWFFNELAQYEYEIKADGSITPMKDGKLVQNAQGYTRPMDDIAKEIAEKYYDFNAADPRGTPPGKGSDPAGAGAGAKVQLIKPTSRQNYVDQVNAIRNNQVLTQEDKTKNLIELDKLNDDAKKIYEPN